MQENNQPKPESYIRQKAMAIYNIVTFPFFWLVWGFTKLFGSGALYDYKNIDCLNKFKLSDCKFKIEESSLDLPNVSTLIHYPNPTFDIELPMYSIVTKRNSMDEFFDSNKCSKEFLEILNSSNYNSRFSVFNPNDMRPNDMRPSVIILDFPPYSSFASREDEKSAIPGKKSSEGLETLGSLEETVRAEDSTSIDQEISQGIADEKSAYQEHYLNFR